MTNRPVTCARCEQFRVHRSHGLCQPCYRHLARIGGLDSYRPTNVKFEDHLASIDKSDPDACWPWPGPLKESGYGQSQGGAHRRVWRTLIGAIPEGVTLDHACHTRDHSCPGGPTCLHRRCVNPAHLVPADIRPNVLAGRGPSAENARKTHCKHGHEFTEANTLITREGHRDCRACRRAKNARRRARRSAARSEDRAAESATTAARSD